VKPQKPVEGVSLLPSVAGKPAQPRTLYWEHEGNQAMRDGEWKLVREHGKEWELFQLGKDRSELQNLAAAEPARLKQMKDRWQKWADGAGVLPWLSWEKR
jgi:arylsulfatase A-like enzyme